MSNYINDNVCDEITYPFANLNGEAIISGNGLARPGDKPLIENHITQFTGINMKNIVLMNNWSQINYNVWDPFTNMD